MLQRGSFLDFGVCLEITTFRPMIGKSRSVHPQPSAPPLETSSGRVVQPMQVVMVAEPADRFETDNLLGQRTRGYRTNVVKQAGKVESREAARKIAESNVVDGIKLLHAEHSMVVQSEGKGMVESFHANMKITKSNADDVHELGVSLADEDVNYTANPFLSCDPAIEKKVREMMSAQNLGGTFSKPNPAEGKMRSQQAEEPGGYQFSEYTSMYENQGGYKYDDYKSMYDK
jgi:hypothetical protein